MKYVYHYIYYWINFINLYFLFQKQIEDLADRLMCTEENLETKRNELEEKNELYETVQEELIQLRGELNCIRSESDTASKFRW